MDRVETVRRILVPLDLTALGEAKLPVAREYARAFDAEVVLLHVLPPRAVEPEVVLPTEATARAYLDVVVAGMTGAGIRAAALIRAGPTAATIVEEAREHRADLIILGSNVRPLLRSVVIGSVADEVVRTAPCPVLLVRPVLTAAAAPPLRSFNDDAARAGPLRRRSLGVRTVEVGRIIGSVGRSRELGPDFRPAGRRSTGRRSEDEVRFERIRAAMEAGESLPPVELYKLGFGYYVLDGHHRVAAARLLGQMELEADVTEFVPLADAEAARTFAERRAFERSTGLTDVGAAHPDSYPRLAAMIDAYRAERGIADYRDAAQRWYREVYRPLWRRVRERQLTHYFPGDRSADFVARIGVWRARAAAEGTPPADWDEALDRFVASLDRRDAPPAGPEEGSLNDAPPPAR
jgi:nucleotide-binding universal stress UspA family protein